jgi:hypothetical protein
MRIRSSSCGVSLLAASDLGDVVASVAEADWMPLSGTDKLLGGTAGLGSGGGGV